MRRLAPFFIALALYGGALLIMQPSPTGDEPHYALEAISIARDGDVDLRDEYADPDLVEAVYGSPSLPPHAFEFPGQGEELRSVHNPLLPALLAPVAAVTTSVGWMRVEMAVIAALGALLLMVLLERVPFGSARLRWAAWAAVVACAPIVVYAVQVYPEMPAVVLTLAAAVTLTGRRRGLAELAAASTAAALLPWLNVRFLAVTLALAAILAWLALRDRRPATLAAAAGPLAVSGLLFAAAFQHWYGSPWPDAQYALSESPRTLSAAYRFGIGGLLSPVYGWLPFAPVHLLGVVAIGLLVRRLGRPAAVGLAAAALYLLVVAASGSGFPGFSFAARQQLVAIPLVAVPLLVLLALRPRWRWGFAVLAIVSAALTGQAVADSGQPSAPEPGSPRAAYDELWPNFSVDQPQGTWRATAADLDHDVGELTAEPPLPPIADVALAAPAGARGVLARGTTSALPPDAYDFGVALRADEPVDAIVATIVVRDAEGEVVREREVTGREVPPRIGYRAILGSFHSATGGPFEITVTTTGATGLRSGGMQVLAQLAGSVAGESGFPGLPLALVWVGGLAAVGVGVARRPVRWA